MYEQRIQGRHMGMYTHGHGAYVNANENRTEVVTRTSAHRQKHMQHTNTVCGTEADHK